ncbi:MULTISPECIES: DNA cytosine methyltransferase, partial [Bacteroidales]
MTHASLFSGIGGFDLAAEWAGWTNAFNCEIDPFCRTILKYHFPNAKQYED